MFTLMLISCLNINQCSVVHSEASFAQDKCEMAGMFYIDKLKQDVPTMQHTYLCVPTVSDS